LTIEVVVEVMICPDDIGGQTPNSAAQVKCQLHYKVLLRLQFHERQTVAVGEEAKVQG